MITCNGEYVSTSRVCYIRANEEFNYTCTNLGGFPIGKLKLYIDFEEMNHRYFLSKFSLTNIP